ncbi:hypothetical protein ASA1KI_39700 [Opitutales bacterium ASA1]|uniref:tyrosine-type recombinase/integrase n=1 Tax=Congregicoccus parvus TaxID=3081749 RepID=UPI002B3250C9|nr:hypothetical protein ASA1KI_39700 [Opitutales bacterium ASA1]
MRSDWALSVDQKADARAALRLLEGTGHTLVEAARMIMRERGRAPWSPTWEEAGSAFLRSRKERGLRESTRGWYAREIGLAGNYGLAGEQPWDKRKLDSFTRADVMNALADRSPGVRPAVLRVLRAVFRWAMTEQEPPWVVNDPTRGVKASAPRRDREISVLTPAQCRTLLAGAGPHRAALALALFSGLRPWEIAGQDKDWLGWDAIDERERVVKIPAAIAKGRGAGRLEGLPEALWAWLASVPKSERGATVAVARFREIGRLGRKLLGLRTWPRDATRHSFASYAVREYKDPGKVALWLRHEGDQRLLYQHYLAAHVSAAEASEFFALRPSP